MTIEALVKGFKQTGKYITIFGMGCLFLMAVVGSISVDFVILIGIVTGKIKPKVNDNPFLTGFLIGRMTSHHGHHHGNAYDAGMMLLASPFITGIAVALAFHFNMPTVGLSLVYGWAGAAGITLLGGATSGIGYGLEYYCITNHDGSPTPTPSHDIEMGNKLEMVPQHDHTPASSYAYVSTTLPTVSMTSHTPQPNNIHVTHTNYPTNPYTNLTLTQPYESDPQVEVTTCRI